MALSAICCGVTGRYCDMLGVWMDPVTAQLMMTFSDRFIETSRIVRRLVYRDHPAG